MGIKASTNRSGYIAVCLGILLTVFLLAKFQNQKNANSLAGDKEDKSRKHPTTTAQIPAPLGAHSYSDRPDDEPNLYQLHVLYIVTKDFKNTTRDLDNSIEMQTEQVNKWFSEQTGGRTLRFDTYNGKLDITFIILPLTESELLNQLFNKYGKFDPAYRGLVYLHYMLDELLEQADALTPIFSPGKLYVAYFDISLAYVCGDGPAAGSRIIGLYPNAFNLRDQNNCKAFLGTKDDNTQGVWEHILAHEIIHGLGFPNTCAKNITKDKSHIDDPNEANDIMGLSLGIYDKNPILDQNHDDYYLTNYANCPDLSNSPFLDPLPENPSLPEDVLPNKEWRLSN